MHCGSVVFCDAADAAAQAALVAVPCQWSDTVALLHMSHQYVVGPWVGTARGEQAIQIDTDADG